MDISELQQRTLSLNDAGDVSGDCVVYIMCRDQRIHDNHALLLAQQKAQQCGVGLVIVVPLASIHEVKAREQYQFMLDGLAEVAAEARALGIGFLCSTQTIDACIPSDWRVSAIVCDFTPLQPIRASQKKLASQSSCSVVVVDAHNCIPVWVASDKEEFAAHTFRPKLHRQLAHWLTPADAITMQSIACKVAIPDDHFERAQQYVLSLPSNGTRIAKSAGPSAAYRHAKMFFEQSIMRYAKDRNNPCEDGQSELSPYLHFGHIAPLRVLLMAMEVTDTPPLLMTQPKMPSYEGEPTVQDALDAFVEELVVRRELADNYCFYSSSYTQITGAKEWAQTTIQQHRDDPRDFLYTRDQWENGATHDEAWNAAQFQLRKTGRLHGYMRMYWAKKILEWSKTPQEALDTALYLNDFYALDGNDPNGYVGVMWSIAGVHDRAWFERPVYGKIRYMNAGGLKRKFPIASYIERWAE